jgi:aminoglycoside phosphotransferase (APT) family kinase protein
VEPRVYERGGFVVTFWVYYEPAPHPEIAPGDYAHALERLHAGMREVDYPVPHFTERVDEAQQLIASRDQTPALADADRELLGNTLRRLRRVAGEGAGAEQILHGEPHPGNVLKTKNGPLFMDFEDSVHGPVEFDLAWVPKEVSERYPDADQALVGEFRGVVLAMIAAHRWSRDDQHPSGRQSGVAFLNALRVGPPWPPHDAVVYLLYGRSDYIPSDS